MSLIILILMVAAFFRQTTGRTDSAAASEFIFANPTLNTACVSISMYDERILAPETTDAFLWILVVGAFGAFFAAFGIGANDVANAFATSVGAKALTIKQAVVLAVVFLGSHVAKTIRKGNTEVILY